MGFFAKAKQAFKEKEAERAELKKIYKEEYAKEKELQESGRRLAAREEARDRARAKARIPPLSQRLAVGAGRLASGAVTGVKGYIKSQAKQQKPPKGGTDFLGFGGGVDFLGGDLFGAQPARIRSPKRRVRSVLKARAKQPVININLTPIGTSTRGIRKKRKSRTRSQPALGVDWF